MDKNREFRWIRNVKFVGLVEEEGGGRVERERKVLGGLEILDVYVS